MSQPQKILVAEDERPMAHALELKLTRSGYTVKTAFDGEEALQYLTSEPFDLVLLDLVMPKKDGFAVLQGLQDKHITTPVIVSSNLSQAEDAKRAKALGASDYFIKSDTPISKVVEHVRRVLGDS